MVKIVRRGELVVDVSCGVETWSTLLTRNQAYVVSLDYSPKTLIKCGEKARSLKVESQVLRILADGFYLPFQKQTFVGATLNWVLAHIPANKNFMFLREISRVIKADGWLVISDSYWRGQEGGKEQVQVGKTGNKAYEIYKYYYTLEEIKQLLENHLETLKT